MFLLNQYGQEIKSNKPIIDEVAVQSVRDRYESYPSYGLTPDRLAAIFKEADQGYIIRQAELFAEMEEKDGHLASVIQTRKLAVAGLTWEMLPASDSADDKAIAAAAKDMINNIADFSSVLIDMLDAIAKGFSVQEIMWELDGGQVNIKRLNWIHQKRFTFSGPPQTVGNWTMQPLLSVPRFLTDDNPIWGEELIPNKFVFHRHKGRAGITSRGGVLRPSAYMYLFKNYNIKDWLIFNELFSVPMRIGKYKSGADPKEIDALKRAVFNLGVDAAAVISDSTVIEILETASRTSSGGFKELTEFCDKTISKVWLGHSSSSESTPGKLGGEQAAREVRQDLLEFDAKNIELTLREQILSPWTRYNFGPDKAVPRLKFHCEDEEDLEKIATAYSVLVKDMGFDGIPKSHIYNRFSIPMPIGAEDTIKPGMRRPLNK